MLLKILLSLTKKAIGYSQTAIKKIFNGNVVLGSRLVPLHPCFVLFTSRTLDRTLIMRLQFNQRVTRVKTRNMSAVKWVALVTCVFLLCYGILMRCSFFVLTGHKCTDDLHYKLPVQGINSGLNPIAYAMFKRDIKQECKRYLFKRSRCLTTEQLLC